MFEAAKNRPKYRIYCRWEVGRKRNEKQYKTKRIERRRKTSGRRRDTRVQLVWARDIRQNKLVDSMLIKRTHTLELQTAVDIKINWKHFITGTALNLLLLHIAVARINNTKTYAKCSVYCVNTKWNCYTVCLHTCTTRTHWFWNKSVNEQQRKRINQTNWNQIN